MSKKEQTLFLDLNVTFGDGKFTTYLHFKRAYKHQHLHYTSLDPNHTRRSMLYSQALRFSRICFYKNGFEKHRGGIKSRFGVRSYPDKLVKSELGKTIFF